MLTAKYSTEGLFAAEAYFLEEFKGEWLELGSEFMPGLVVINRDHGDIYFGILPPFWNGFKSTKKIATFLSNIFHCNLFSRQMSVDEMDEYYTKLCPTIPLTDVKALKRRSMLNHAARFLTCTQILPGIFRNTSGKKSNTLGKRSRKMKFTLAYIPAPLRDHRLQTLMCGMGDIMKIYGTDSINAEELSWPLTLKMFEEMCPSHPYFHGATMNASVLQKCNEQHDLKFLGRVQWNFSGIICNTSLAEQSDPADQFFRAQEGQLRSQLGDPMEDVWDGISAPLVIPALPEPTPIATPLEPLQLEDTCSLFDGSQVSSLGSWHASQPPPDDSDLFSNDPYP